MPNPIDPQLFSQTDFLASLNILFGGDSGQITSSGLPDGGLNCNAKLFAITVLMKSFGFEVETCCGECFLATPELDPAIFLDIAPHSWVGSPNLGMFDYSMYSNETLQGIYVSENRVRGLQKCYFGLALNREKFESEKSRFMDNPRDSLALYFLEKQRFFDPAKIFVGRAIVDSPVTQDLLANFSDPFVLAKGVYFLRLELEGNSSFGRVIIPSQTPSLRLYARGSSNFNQRGRRKI